MCSIHEDTPGQAHKVNNPSKYGSIHILQRNLSYPYSNPYPALAADNIVFKIWNDNGYVCEANARINNNVVWYLFDSLPVGEYSFAVIYKKKDYGVHVNAIKVSENKTT